MLQAAFHHITQLKFFGIRINSLNLISRCKLYRLQGRLFKLLPHEIGNSCRESQLLQGIIQLHLQANPLQSFAIGLEDQVNILATSQVDGSLHPIGLGSGLGLLLQLDTNRHLRAARSHLQINRPCLAFRQLHVGCRIGGTQQSGIFVVGFQEIIGVIDRHSGIRQRTGHVDGGVHLLLDRKRSTTLEIGIQKLSRQILALLSNQLVGTLSQGDGSGHLVEPLIVYHGILLLHHQDGVVRDVRKVFQLRSDRLRQAATHILYNRSCIRRKAQR